MAQQEIINYLKSGEVKTTEEIAKAIRVRRSNVSRSLRTMLRIGDVQRIERKMKIKIKSKNRGIYIGNKLITFWQIV